MDRALSHEEITDLLGAYALDAVDPDEAAVIAEHLTTCPRCAAEVAEHREVVGLVANAGVDAPPELWERIAAQVSGDDGAPRSSMVVPGPGSPTRRAARSGAGRRRRAWSLAALVVAAAAVAVITILGVQVSHLDHRIGQLATASERSGLEQSVQAALLDPDARRVALEAPSPSAGAGTRRAPVVLVILPDGSGYALNAGLPRLGGGRTYQLWGALPGRVVSLGLLGSDPRTVAFRVDPSAPVAGFAVTAEVRGGVVQTHNVPVAASATA